MVLINCSQCGVEKSVSPVYVHRALRNFCSVECRKAWHKGENHPNWRGGKHIDTQGYRYHKINGKAVYEHRIIMSEHLGRKLETWEHVHHINHNKLDNRLVNLRVLSSSEHGKLHPMIGWAKKFNKCVECGTTKKKHYSFGFCKNCYMRRYLMEYRKRAKAKTQISCDKV